MCPSNVKQGYNVEKCCIILLPHHAGAAPVLRCNSASLQHEEARKRWISHDGCIPLNPYDHRVKSNAQRDIPLPEVSSIGEGRKEGEAS